MNSISQSAALLALRQKDTPATNVEPKKKQSTFECHFCDYSSKRKQNLSYHLLTHTGEKPHKCSFCAFSSAQMSYVKTHEKIHTGEKSFQCSFCSYKSAFKNCVERHKRIHTGEKPYKCPHCPYSCARKSSLRLHLMNHTGWRPFKCTRCPFAFKTKMNLINHERLHTGEKPFSCRHCLFSTSRKSCLTRHERIHTKEKPCKSSTTFARKDSRKCHEKTQDPQLQTTPVNIQERNEALGPTEDEDRNDFSVGKLVLKCPHCNFTTRYACFLKRHQHEHKKRGSISYLMSDQACLFQH